MTRLIALACYPLWLAYLRAVLVRIERQAPRSLERMRVEREIADTQARLRRLNHDWERTVQ